MNHPKISMVIGSFNRCKLLQLCIDAVRRELDGESYEIIVVDGGSTDGTVEWLTQQKDIISIIQHNRGEWNGKTIERKPWAYFMNLAFKCASGKYICMLSDDSLIVPGAILNGVDLFDEMLEQGVKLGGVAFYFRDYPVRKKYAVAVNVGNLYVNHGLYLNAAMKEVGYCDEAYHFYFSDTDLCLKMKAAGYKVIPSKTSFVEHYFEATPEIRASNNDERKLADRQRLIDKWKGSAYPENEASYYQKHVGRWSYHPRRFEDPNKTIHKLIEASSNEGRVDGLKISIVTVVYDDAEGLERTIRSVLNLDYANVEYIVIDGASPDSTQKILRRYSDQIDVLVSEPDEGIYDAMNKGIKEAGGEFLIFMNAGDEFASKDVLSKVAVQMQNDAADVIYGDRNYVDENGSVLQKAKGKEHISKGMPYCHQSAFYRLSTLEKFPFKTHFLYSSDYNQIVELYKAEKKFLKLDEVICNFHAGGQSESGIRPYLEVLKIQFDNFGDGENMSDSVYMKGLIKHKDKLLEKYK